jgi:K+:H+ antiporter
MDAHPVFFRDFAYVFLAATAGGIVAWKLRQPLIIGYVLAGAVISPFTPGPKVEDVETLELFAEIGVILLMFSVGLEFSLKDLLKAKGVALVGGSAGILLLIGMGTAAGSWMGLSLTEGMIIGMITCVASTMVMTRLLMDRGELRTEHGLVMVSITLVEDIAVIVLIVLIPSFGSLEAGSLLSVALGIGKAALILVPVFFAAAKIIPPLLERVARTKSRELFFVVVLAIGLGTAALTQAVGLSLALGAFAAGLIISNSQFAHQALAELFSLRDAFVALFFVTIGLLISPATLFSNVKVLGLMLGLIILGKFVVWTVIILCFRYSIWTALMAAVGLTQIGEFSFIIVKTARAAGLVGSDIYNATLAASLISILVNAALLRVVPGWIKKARQSSTARKQLPTSDVLRDHVVLCGFGRVGSAIGVALDQFHVPYLVIENDTDVIQALRSRNIPGLFGDAAHSHLLQEAGVRNASLVIVTLSDARLAQLAITNVRKLNAGVPVLSRSETTSDIEHLKAAGATDVVQPEFVASAKMVQIALHSLGLPQDRIADYLEAFQGTPVEVRDLTVLGPPLAGHNLREARIRERFGITVVSIRRQTGEILANPASDIPLLTGDRLRVFGMLNQIDAMSAELGLR